MSAIMSSSRPRSSVMLSGTCTPAIAAQRVDEAVRRLQADGQLQDLAARRTSFPALWPRLGGRGTQGQLAPAVAGGANLLDRGAALGIELVLSGLRSISTSEVSGNMIVHAQRRARRFISRMSPGSTQPGTELICLLLCAAGLGKVR